MKTFCSVLLALSLCLFSAALAETANVTTPEELFAALESDAVDSIEITADMTIYDNVLLQTKDVTILSDVVFQPAPDDGFFVKSWEIPEGVVLHVKGNLTTVHTFEDGFAIAQVYVNGGTLDVSEGMVSNRICFNAGTVIPPENGFAADVEIGRFLYMDVTEEDLIESVTDPIIWITTLQADCTIKTQIVVPEGKELQLSAMLTIDDGATLTGSVSADPGCGVILLGSGQLNDLTVPEGMEACMVVWGEDNAYTVMEYSETPVPVTIGEWLEAEGRCGNCVLTVTVKEILNPALALVEDETGEVNLFGVQIDGVSVSVFDSGIQAGDVLTLSNPKYNVYDGNVEMADATLVK